MNSNWELSGVIYTAREQTAGWRTELSKPVWSLYWHWMQYKM